MFLRFSIVPKMDPHYLWIPVIGLVLLDVIGVIGVAYGAFPVSPLYILYLVYYREKTLSFSFSLSSHTHTHTHTHTHSHNFFQPMPVWAVYIRKSNNKHALCYVSATISHNVINTFSSLFCTHLLPHLQFLL